MSALQAASEHLSKAGAALHAHHQAVERAGALAAAQIEERRNATAQQPVIPPASAAQRAGQLPAGH